MNTFKILLLLIAVSVQFGYSQQVIKLYEGKAPGSETWNWQEQNLGTSLRDVVDPTLTVYRPENPNGISLIVAPGGAFHFLAWEHEGVQVAKRLNEKGITVFVLKYRLVHEDPSHPYLMKMLQEGDGKLMDSVSAPVIKLAMQDGLNAVKYVREHAKEYNIKTNRIGFAGFSAGGTIAMSVVLNAMDENRPNFVASIYGWASAVIKSKVPTVSTPLFICAASDDNAVPVLSNSLPFYSMWLEAKQPVEMHLFSTGGHGYGMNKQKMPVDDWIDRFTDWIFFNYTQK